MMYLNREEEFINMNNFLDEIAIELNNIKLDLEDIKSNYSELVNIIEEEVNRNRISISELKNPFLLFIIGSGNYGKSTLINCLIRDKFIKTTDLPNTWKLDLFIKSKKEKIDFIYNDNTKDINNIDEGLKLINLEEKKYKDSKKKISKLANEYKNTQEFDISKIQKYKAELEKKYLYKSNITEIKYYIDKDGVLKDFIIVDTPGLNQTLSKNTYERMMKYYKRADGIIWMIDAQNLISKESYNLIQEINKIEKDHDSKKDIIGVVNKMDIISISKYDNVEKVKLKAKELYANKFNELVFISAKKALEGIVTKDEDIYASSNLNELLESIQSIFFTKSEEKQIQSKYKNLYIMKDEILRNITTYKREVYNDISKYNESKFRQKESIRRFKIFTKEYLNSINKKYVIGNDKENSLLDELEEFQQICTIELNKIYNDTIYKSNLTKTTISQELKLQMKFTKSKYIIQNQYIYSYIYDIKKDRLKDILNIIRNESNKKEVINGRIVFNLKDNIFKLTQEINEIIDENIQVIENNIDEVRINIFRSKNIEYEKVRKHIGYLNNIERILTNLR